jgi:gamma-glutamyltranspeptidase/glutathione hydrolase
MNRIITSPTSRSTSRFSVVTKLICSATFANADHGTSNITATDSSGLMCSVTTTVGLPWGSGIMVPKWGLVLNDSMDDFSIEGRPNGFGYEPSPTNLGKSADANLKSANEVVKGRKRPLSSSCPYIVEKDGRPILIGGAAGGSAIITSNIQVARNVLVSFSLPTGQS